MQFKLARGLILKLEEIEMNKCVLGVPDKRKGKTGKDWKKEAVAILEDNSKVVTSYDMNNCECTSDGSAPTAKRHNVAGY